MLEKRVAGSLLHWYGLSETLRPVGFLIIWTGELPESDPYRWGFNRLINIDVPNQLMTTIGPIHSFYNQATNTIQETAGFLFSPDTIALVSYTYYFGSYVQLHSIDPSTGAPSLIADLKNHPRSYGVGCIPFDNSLSVWAGGDYPDDSIIGLIKISNV